MTRSRAAREIVCGIFCALALAVVVPFGIVLLLLFSVIDGVARLCGKAGARRGQQ